jgi:hypothetical protein
MTSRHAYRQERRERALAQFIPESIPSLEPGDHVLFSPGIEGVSVGGVVVDGPDAEDTVVVAYAGSEPCVLDRSRQRWLQPGDRYWVGWGDGLTGLVLGPLRGPLGNAVAEGRIVQPIAQAPVVREVMELRPGQPLPGSPKAFVRRNRAGNTLRVQTSRGTWAPINVAADGTRFERYQLTTKICQGARERLDVLAADAQLRVCEVLEALILDPGAAQTVAAAQPVGVKVLTPARPTRRAQPEAKRRQRTRLTQHQGQELDSILLELLKQKRTGAGDLLQAAATASALGLPAQGLNTLRTRLHRLQKRLRIQPSDSDAA